MQIINFFHPAYYIDSYLTPDFKWLWPLVVWWGLILLAAIVVQLRYRGVYKNWSGGRKFWWTHWSNMSYTVSILALAHLFFRFQNIPYFNWRLWPALLVIGILGWLGYLIYYRYRIQPKKQADRKVRRAVASYFRRRR